MNTTDNSDEELLREYAPILRKIVSITCCSSPTLDSNDLYQIGEIAILRAIKAYDPTCGSNIKSFVARTIKRDVFNEAARFLGVFTVDHKVTALANKAFKMHEAGMSDEDISVVISKSCKRNIDADHVRDLRTIYGKKQYSYIESDEDLLFEDGLKEDNLRSVLDLVINNKEEDFIVTNRLLGSMSIEEAASILSISNKKLYSLENNLKQRIYQAIKNHE